MINFEILEEVQTDLGRATVVGLMDGGTLVEVRYPTSRALRVWPWDRVTPIATPEAVADYEKMKEQGINPTVPREVQEYQNGDVIEFETRETIPIEDVPRGKTGKPLHGIALKKHLARKQGEDQ